MRRILLCLAAFGLPAAAQAECRGPQGLPKPQDLLPVVEGHFHYHPDKGLGCAVSQQVGQAMTEKKGPVSFLSCLRIGPVKVSDSRYNVEKLLGEPSAVSEIDLSSESRLYEVQQRGVLRPHYVVTYRDDRVVAVQLVGPPMVIPATFSGLTLGDDQRKIIDTLGQPAERCRTRADGPEMWTWAGFPIAIDVIDGYAAGFKITWPAGK